VVAVPKRLPTVADLRHGRHRPTPPDGPAARDRSSPSVHAADGRTSPGSSTRFRSDAGARSAASLCPRRTSVRSKASRTVAVRGSCRP